ncbi:MAG: class I SAM-dependent methyltransferase [bacterium]
MKTNSVINPFISFYTKYKISPVHQDIRNFRRHLLRREKLYRLLGLVPVTFKDKAILEIGPGGGYNALVLFLWGANIDFIEPNPKAREELPILFKKYKIKDDRWKLFPCKAEEFEINKKYDVVIAEGFIPGLYRRNEVIAKISDSVNFGGVVVVTCVDELSFFFELVKRLIAHRFLQKKNAEEFSKKVTLLSRAFSSHLKSLKFASRPIQDWVTDNFLNPAIYGNFFSVAECIEEFGENFMPLGSSPSMFTDYSWYKDTEFNSRNSFLEQFYAKRHVLMSWNMPETIRTKEANNNLAQEISELRKFAGKAEQDLTEKSIKEIVKRLQRIKGLIRAVDIRIYKAINEAIGLLLDKDLDEFKISHASGLASAFGRGQQYLSLAKKFTT